MYAFTHQVALADHLHTARQRWPVCIRLPQEPILNAATLHAHKRSCILLQGKQHKLTNKELGLLLLHKCKQFLRQFLPAVKLQGMLC
jgi:hypothetical protein